MALAAFHVTSDAHICLIKAAFYPELSGRHTIPASFDVPKCLCKHQEHQTLWRIPLLACGYFAYVWSVHAKFVNEMQSQCISKAYGGRWWDEAATLWTG